MDVIYAAEVRKSVSVSKRVGKREDASGKTGWIVHKPDLQLRRSGIGICKDAVCQLPPGVISWRTCMTMASKMAQESAQLATWGQPSAPAKCVVYV